VVRLFLLISILATSRIASAAVYITGNELYDWLSRHRKIASGTVSSEDYVPLSSGLGYVLGVIDSVQNCIPTGVIRAQLQEITLQYLEIHPEERHLLAVNLVRRAIAEKFPCPKR
jgi:hypothetical protein